ncbi:hypothetical protein LRP88_02462 [Fusarium phalaenopsidis]
MIAIFNRETGHSGNAAASPYIIALGNLGIGVLPHILTALILTTIFAAGNSVTFYGIRSIYGLSIEGRAPKFLRKTTKQGVPISCVVVVLTWLIDLATGCTIVDYIVIAITYICFRRTTPYSAWLAIIWEILIIFYGCKSFSPWDVGSFFIYYAMVILIQILFGWNYVKGTKWLKLDEVDLVWDAPYITAYEDATPDRPIGFFREFW